MKANELLLYLSYKYDGDWHKLYQAIRVRESVIPQLVEDFAKNFTTQYVTIVDEDYPSILKECHQPPFVLFYRGNIKLIKEWRNCITIVGSRDAKPYGVDKCREISGGIAKEGYTIVSGLARGIDTAAIRGALPFGKAVGVLGTGLDTAYPNENRELQELVAQKGLIITEFPNGVGVRKENFPCRNRILASLSCLTLLGGSAKHSGTLITAGIAVDMGREVACLPYRADEGSSNNLLIQTGAALVQNAEDVLNLIRPAK